MPPSCNDTESTTTPLPRCGRGAGGEGLPHLPPSPLPLLPGERKGRGERSSGDPVPSSFYDTESTNQLTPLPRCGRGAGGEGSPQRGRGAGGEGSPQRGRGAGGEVDWRERTLATPHVIHAMAARVRYVPNETFLIRLLDMSTRFVVCLYSSWQGSYHF